MRKINKQAATVEAKRFCAGFCLALLGAYVQINLAGECTLWTFVAFALILHLTKWMLLGLGVFEAKQGNEGHETGTGPRRETGTDEKRGQVQLLTIRLDLVRSEDAQDEKRTRNGGRETGRETGTGPVIDDSPGSGTF